ncbi:hypothetical protein AOLI_G00060080 [Acnodon oligacanthus]
MLSKAWGLICPGLTLAKQLTGSTRQHVANYFSVHLTDLTTGQGAEDETLPLLLWEKEASEPSVATPSPAKLARLGLLV